MSGSATPTVLEIRAVACPECSADVDDPCHDKQGWTQEQFHDARVAVARSRKARVEITLRMSAHDFERLTDTAMEWRGTWDEHRGRFENLDGPFDPTYHPHPKWQLIYWFEDYSSVLLARAFLDTQGIEYEAAFDAAEDGPAHVILTNFVSPAWARRTPS
jgi:hypothetical protein